MGTMATICDKDGCCNIAGHVMGIESVEHGMNTLEHGASCTGPALEWGKRGGAAKRLLAGHEHALQAFCRV